jgi:hypothetical protein
VNATCYASVLTCNARASVNLEGQTVTHLARVLSLNECRYDDALDFGGRNDCDRERIDSISIQIEVNAKA